MKKTIRNLFRKYDTFLSSMKHFRRYQHHSFKECQCVTQRQFDASITKLYHAIEKGLSYPEFRPGFGGDTIEKLLESMEQYARSYNTNTFFYQTALSTLNEYIRRNADMGYKNKQLQTRIARLKGQGNTCGGYVAFCPLPIEQVQKLGYKDFVTNRHSIRHFSALPVDTELIKAAVRLAQRTPSACNRQGWKTKIISDKSLITHLLENQNGNRGFGQEIDKLLVVVSDLNYFNYDRELFQSYIDGGMYAMNLIYSLHYYGLGSVPLSAALTNKQENAIRKLLNMDDAEELILFIGVGNYRKGENITTKSERKDAIIEII